MKSEQSAKYPRSHVQPFGKASDAADGLDVRIVQGAHLSDSTARNQRSV